MHWALLGAVALDTSYTIPMAVYSGSCFCQSRVPVPYGTWGHDLTTPPSHTFHETSTSTPGLPYWAEVQMSREVNFGILKAMDKCCSFCPLQSPLPKCTIQRCKSFIYMTSPRTPWVTRKSTYCKTVAKLGLHILKCVLLSQPPSYSLSLLLPWDYTHPQYVSTWASTSGYLLGESQGPQQSQQLWKRDHCPSTDWLSWTAVAVTKLQP